MNESNSDQINELIQVATNHLKLNYKKNEHHVAAALKTKSDIYLSLHLDTKGFDVCAEPIALSNALAKKDFEFEYIVAVIMSKDGSINVVSPCGNCRQILLQYAPNINVIIDGEDAFKIVEASSLLPYPY